MTSSPPNLPLPFSTVAAPTPASRNPPAPRMGTSEHLHSFQLYSRLPTELRIKIWRFAIPQPQVIRFEYEPPPAQPRSLDQTMQYKYKAFFDRDGGIRARAPEHLRPLIINRDRFSHTNGEYANLYCDAGPLERRGTWDFTSGLNYLSVLRICQESRAETKNLIGNYMMIRLNPGAQHVWYNPAKDSLVIVLEVTNTKLEKLIPPSFPVRNSIKDVMASKMFERMTERKMERGIDEPVVALPDFFECNARFWRPSPGCPEEWARVWFHYFGRPGVKTFGMSMYTLFRDFPGYFSPDRAPGPASDDGKLITPPFIDIRDSSRPTPENREPELSMDSIDFTWTGNEDM